LENDQKRVDKKMEELYQKILELEHESEIQKIENKYNALKDKEDPTDQIWAEIYNDALKLEKRSKYPKDK
jgi:ribonuclease HIII